MLSTIKSCGLVGVEPYILRVEVDVSKGLPTLSTTVGLPDAAVKESRARVQAAIKNCGFEFPAKKITVNLSPAAVKKEGPSFDLPIALGILAATGQLQAREISHFMFLGELSLDGTVRRVKGVLPAALAARKKDDITAIFVPEGNKKEAGVVEGIKVFPVKNLHHLISHLKGEISLDEFSLKPEDEFKKGANYPDDFSDVKGQLFAKRALEVAAAGGHNVLLIGPPGAGKTMLAKRLPTILPSLSLEESLQTTEIHSVAGILSPDTAILTTRPFRSPHHTISDIALIGGGAFPKPGEVSLAHNGVLFLDEFHEFHRNVLEVLRQPLEEGRVTIARAQVTLAYPSSFILVAAMNPCPCGYYGHPYKECTCTTFQIQRYLSKISGPLIDRIDLHIEVPALEFTELTEETTIATSGEIREKVERTRKIQRERFKNENIFSNSQISPQQIKKYCAISKSTKKLLERAFSELYLSARAYDRILKVARTIADLEAVEKIETQHIAEAIQYRSLDRQYRM